MLLEHFSLTIKQLKHWINIFYLNKKIVQKLDKKKDLINKKLFSGIVTKKEKKKKILTSLDKKKKSYCFMLLREFKNSIKSRFSLVPKVS